MKVVTAAAGIGDLSSPELLAGLVRALPEERGAGAGTRPASVGARALLAAVFDMLGYRLSGLVIARGACGKPYISGPCPLHFSLSHSGDIVMCAVCDVPVGCDTEYTGRRRPRVAGRFFSEGERAYLSGAEGAGEDGDAFFRLWTLKESFQKLTGLGFALPMSEFTVDLTGDQPAVSCPWPSGDCRFFEESEGGYRFAAAVSGREFLPMMRYSFERGAFLS